MLVSSGKEAQILAKSDSQKELVQLNMIRGSGLDFYFVERDLVSQSDSIQQVRVIYK